MHSHTRLKPSLFTLSGLAYSLVSYVFFLLVFIYLMGFDATIGGAQRHRVGADVLAMATRQHHGLRHSVTARHTPAHGRLLVGLNRRVVRHFPDQSL